MYNSVLGKINKLQKQASVSWRFNIICIKFKIIAFCIITLVARLLVRVGILLTCEKHLRDRMLSLTRGCAHKTSLRGV